MADINGSTSIPTVHTTDVWETKSLPLDSTHYTALAFILATCVPQARRGTALRYGLLLLQITCVFQAFFARPSPIPERAVVYTSGVLMGNLAARYFDRLYSTIPEESFKRVLSKEPTVLEDVDKLSSPQRFFWALELFSVTRGIGWNWRVSGIPKPSTQTTRFHFAAAQLSRWVAMYAGLHLIEVICADVLSNPDTMFSLPRNMHLYALIVGGFAMTIYSHFGILMLPLSALCVGCQVGPRAWQDATAWPPNFGSIPEAYSIRRFWGYTWHQQLRHHTGAPGAYLLSLMPTSVRESKSFSIRLVKRYSLLLMSFLVSGCIHACGSYQVTRRFGLPLSDGGEIRYFMMQGMAIMLEDLGCWALGVDDRAGKSPGMMRRWIGYAITLSWYVWTRVQFKAVPVALAMGIQDERGSLFAALELVRQSAAAVPGNFVTGAWVALR